jgi:pyruvate dehydrogenase E2 component (dihydrolipoamide acetyltransferase)
LGKVEGGDPYQERYRMVTAVILPRQGQTVESCVIGQWHKRVGDAVAVGDDLFTYETDKAAFDETAKVGGEMLAIFFAEGDDVPCLETVCVIGTKGEDISAWLPPAAEAAPPATSGAVAGAVAAAIPANRSAPSVGGPVTGADTDSWAISPRARRLAEKHHADLRAVVPSGPKDRVIERDVQALIDAGRLATGTAGSDYALATAGTGIGGRMAVADIESSGAPMRRTAPAAEAQADSYEEKHSTIRKLIARSMNHSLSTMAQLTYNATFDATAMLEFRARLKQAKASGIAERMGLAQTTITLNDLILYAVSRVVKTHRLCNAAFHEDRMVFFNYVNLGVAVDTPRGLMVPTLFQADRLSLAEISSQAKSLSAECRQGTISPDKLKDGTFTVTNLGSLGIESFTPVINPPQTAILGVNCLKTHFRDVDGVAVPYPSMSLSLTCDHRAVDGAPAARFLKDLGSALENFSLLLLK